MKRVVAGLIIAVSAVLTFTASYGDDSRNIAVPHAKSFLYLSDNITQDFRTIRQAGLGDPFARDRTRESALLSSDDTEEGGVNSHRDSRNMDAIDIYNIPQPLVSEITYDFSQDKVKGAPLRSLIDLPSGVGDIFLTGAAFLTNLVVHEFGHEVVANYVGAEGSKLNFFKKDGDDFFLGTSSVTNIDKRSELPYTMGGEFFADLTFEHALRNYRNNPTTYNKALMITSGTDFLWYCMYSFYLTEGNPSYDPIGISERTGISRDMIFYIAAAKTALNAYRIYSGQDRIIPYFSVDRYSASINFLVPFELGSSDRLGLLVDKALGIYGHY